MSTTICIKFNKHIFLCISGDNRLSVSSDMNDRITHITHITHRGLNRKHYNDAII